jgi:hypothetical protein
MYEARDNEWKQVFAHSSAMLPPQGPKWVGFFYTYIYIYIHIYIDIYIGLGSVTIKF